MNSRFSTFICAVCLSATVVADPVHFAGTVELSVHVDDPQPRNWPTIFEVTVKNIGTEPVIYWCGGPCSFPQASTLRVSVRYSAEEEWQEVYATNGQYGQGTGSDIAVKREEAITVPLAINIDPSKEYPMIRIDAREWHSIAPVETTIRMSDDREYLEARRAQAIAAVVSEPDSFQRHIAEAYADNVVIDAMLKLASLDNTPIVSRATKVLSRQKTLPATIGDQLAPLVAQWAPRRSQRDCDLAAIYLTTAALNTESLAARRVVLELLDSSTDAQVIAMLMDALRLSPGDRAWLSTVRDHFQGAILRTGNDKDAAQTANVAVDWLESRIKHLNEGEDKP